MPSVSRRGSLEDDVVDVWFLEGPTPSPTPESWVQALDPSERFRANGFRTPELRARFVAAHALVRTVLSRYAALAPEEWRIAHGPEGRPCLVDPPIDLRFSLSHSQEHAAVAVAVGRSIGIDLEEIDATVDVLGLAGRFFTRNEQAMLRACSGMERPERFTTLWTIKEAVLKTRGAGLSSGLTTVEVQLGASGELVRVTAPDRPWSVAAWSPVDGLRAALAVHSATLPPLRFFAASPLGPVREAPELGPA
ncbi:MAG TPA: 4'-phosphopantetheinyl transferase superfamily protein [Myxococcaceae bacterium]|nr:4'-phosphopantetheinyl transferase superfamily protein [Myxococcaceae bacterium]